jgi:small subunit ribosomal protein S16
MSRGGAKKRPYYRIVVADSRYPRDGRFIERVGTYDPMLPKGSAARVAFKMDRVQHWLGLGARPSDRVARFLAAIDVLPKPAIPEQTKKNKPRAKTLERMREAEEAKKAADEAAAAAAAAAEEAAAAAAAAPAEEPAAEEAPAEETPAEEETKAE